MPHRWDEGVTPVTVERGCGYFCGRFSDEKKKNTTQNNEFRRIGEIEETSQEKTRQSSGFLSAGSLLIFREVKLSLQVARPSSVI